MATCLRNAGTTKGWKMKVQRWYWGALVPLELVKCTCGKTINGEWYTLVLEQHVLPSR